MLICKRWCQIATDEILRTKLDLRSKLLNKGTMVYILLRSVQVLKSAQTEIAHPVFIQDNSDIVFDNYFSKLQYLNLSMAVVSAGDLADLLSKCKLLMKLSLEKCTLNKSKFETISCHEDLEVLNLTMCEGINIDCVQDLKKLTKLMSLNVVGCALDSTSMEYFSQSLPSSITTLTIAGCRKTLTDDNIKDLVQCCPNVVELDLSDCTMLTINTVHTLGDLDEQDHLSLNRCCSIATLMIALLKMKSTYSTFSTFYCFNYVLYKMEIIATLDKLCL